MKAFMVLLCIIATTSSIIAHPVTSKIEIKVSEERMIFEEELLGSSDLGYPITIKQTFQFSNGWPDSLRLQKNRNIISSPCCSTEEERTEFNVTYHMSINGKEYKIEDWQCYDNFTSAIPLPPNMPDTSTIELQYDVLSWYNFALNDRCVPSSKAITVYQFEKGNWYFMTDEMEITDVSIQLPNSNSILLANTNIHQRDSLSYTLELQSCQFPCGVDFCILEKKFFDDTKAQVGIDTDLSMYFLKGVSLDSDSSAIQQLTDKKYMKKETRRMCQSIRRASRLFHDNKPRTLTILYSPYPGGTHCVKGNGHHVIIMDTSMFSGHNHEFYLHELTHCFMPWVDFADNLYDTYGQYLFIESFVQYFSLYLYYEKDKKALENFWVDVYNQLSDTVKTMSITDATERRNEQSLVIYYKTPWGIYQFAKRLGFNRFNRLFIKYIQYTKQAQHVSIPELKQVFLQNGITEEEWDSFAAML